MISPGSVSVGCQVNLANRDPSPGLSVDSQFNNGTGGRALFVMSCPKIHRDISDYFMRIRDASVHSRAVNDVFFFFF